MSDPETNLKALHSLYCDLTGRTLTYQFYVREWSDFAKVFTADDLRAVLSWVERENKKREWQYRIRTDLLRIIGDLAVFDSLKAEAELDQKAKTAKARAYRPSEGDKILGEFRKTEPTAPDRGPVMTRDVLLKNLSELRSNIEKQ